MLIVIDDGSGIMVMLLKVILGVLVFVVGEVCEIMLMIIVWFELLLSV